MQQREIQDILKHLLENMPGDWLKLTTHRIDKFNESLAKTEFVEEFEKLGIATKEEYAELPTAYDYIRLGHPLSCVLEWAIAKYCGLPFKNVISFSSQTMPLMAVLRRSKFSKISTRLIYSKNLPSDFDINIVRDIYGYDFELLEVENTNDLPEFSGQTVLIRKLTHNFNTDVNADYILNFDEQLGSIIQVKELNSDCIPEIQHVRRRESIAMTPHDCHEVLQSLLGHEIRERRSVDVTPLAHTINEITSTTTRPVVGSCGLSIQYAIMMGLIHHTIDKNPGRDIKFVVPPNCYGGTNDQARRVAACSDQVEIIDLPVDSGKNMVAELDRILEEVAKLNAIAFIIAEIPTNPRVEVPDLIKLQDVLAKKRASEDGKPALEPVFILDQTFCPNVKFLGEGDYLANVATISYVSGSKFPSGGLCTAGYCVANNLASPLITYIDRHLKLCKNEATKFQLETLTEQMPAMNERIASAYKNTRSFVEHIEQSLPAAKINFVSHELAEQGFTPSVFSLDLPTKGETHAQREAYKRELNLKLINMMISNIPNASKYCVSYGQLKGCYWTIPATSTQGTTKEGDKDYIVRVSASGDMDLEHHKQVFTTFVESL